MNSQPRLFVRAIRTLLTAIAAGGWLVYQAPVLAEDKIDFGRDVRQILSDNCFLCHGPAEETREADLRLDSREAAVEAGAISPDALLESGILERILSDDPDLLMPPPESDKSLSADEKALLRKWVAQGAEYSQHWAFLPPVRPEVPESTLAGSETWIKNPIDAFVLARNHLEAPRATAVDQLQKPPAQPHELLRRLHLDLTGLPPGLEQIDQYLGSIDSSSSNTPGFDSQAVIEQLLNSEHFGERWARWWLDAARYADSDGYEKDKPRSVWFYRDWVIKALNEDLPYDDFIRWQIAGDLLPSPTQDQLVATGFLRNSMVNEEGGADPEQFRVEAMFDRLDAIGKAVLGITTQCAQCHTHKYDPFSHAEYYQMYAAINDFEEASIACFTPEQQNARSAALAHVAAARERVRSEGDDWAASVESWSRELVARLPRWQTLTPTDLPFEGQKFAVLDDGSILSESYAPTKVSNTFSLTTELAGTTAFRIDALTHPRLPRGGPGRSVYGTGALSEFEVSIAPADDPGKKTELKFTQAYASANPDRSDLLAIYRNKDADKDDRFTGGVGFAIDGDMKSAWSTDVGPGRRNQDQVAVFVLDEPVAIEGPVVVSITLHQKHGGWNSDDNQNYLLGRYRFSVTSDELTDSVIDRSPTQEVAASPTEDGSSETASAAEDATDSGFAHGFAYSPQVESALATPASKRDSSQLDILLDAWVDSLALAGENPSAAWASEARAAREAAWKLFPETDSQLIVTAKSQPTETFVFLRGDFLKHGAQVQPGTPEFLGTLPAGEEPARLRLANWLVRPDAPTTARVVVNRIWQSYFGRGLVASPEDFGVQSAPPSHPKLLDWLAVELVESGWRLKHIHRLIVSSSTYQQSAWADMNEYRNSPQNTLLTRGPRGRVDAESVRDIALAVSGLLNPKIGGRSVYPPAPDFLFEPPTSYGPKIWATENDDQAYRRSLYVHQYRSVPYPVLQAFDAPKGDAACVRRDRSNTPIQALTLLNEPQMLECAKSLGARLLTLGETDRLRVMAGFRLVTCRLPDASELAILLEQLQAARAAVQESPEALKTLGARENGSATASPSELAAYTLVARTLLNLDETITK